MPKMGFINLGQAAAPYMRDAAKTEIEKDGAAKCRCIINVSSTTGTHGNGGQVKCYIIIVASFISYVLAL